MRTPKGDGSDGLDTPELRRTFMDFVEECEERMKEELRAAKKMVAEFLDREIGDIIDGAVEDSPGLLKEHEKLMALVGEGKNLKVTTTVRVENEDGLSQVVEVVCPVVISGSMFKKE